VSLEGRLVKEAVPFFAQSSFDWAARSHGRLCSHAPWISTLTSLSTSDPARAESQSLVYAARIIFFFDDRLRLNQNSGNFSGVSPGWATELLVAARNQPRQLAVPLTKSNQWTKSFAEPVRSKRICSVLSESGLQMLCHSKIHSIRSKIEAHQKGSSDKRHDQQIQSRYRLAYNGSFGHRGFRGSGARDPRVPTEGEASRTQPFAEGQSR
jgi:hypothetical protein